MIVRKFLLVVLAAGLYFCLSYASNKIGYSYFSLFNQDTTEKEDKKPGDDENKIQVALLLDTSGSMSGLIEQTKSQLWNILNELARTEKDKEETTLEIALYEYGNPTKAGNSNQINQLSAFTTDMDQISEKLFSLNTDGGDEYCGTVIQTSLEELEWSNKDGLRIIYIAGNEEFTQGMISYTSACKKAKEKGVTVNTIYCGEYGQGILEYWQAGAIAGGGEYLNINHNAETVYVKTPYDDQINRLNFELNKTYIPIGAAGKVKQLNQISQDQNARVYSSTNAADRAVFKSSKKYKATDWDLADAYKKDKSILSNTAILPDTLQALSIEDLEAKILQISAQRENIQQEIQTLDKKRRVYKTEQSKDDAEISLQNSMINSIKKQAKEKGFEIKE
ncbi:MAG: hypothetical protein ACI8P3_004142 [Saprospiraceae bacterium]|jgi:hypothetical protein